MTQATAAVNLDCATDDDLREIKCDLAADPLYRCYAELLLEARPLRRRGEILAARALEDLADGIYGDLPEELKW